MSLPNSEVNWQDTFVLKDEHWMVLSYDVHARKFNFNRCTCSPTCSWNLIAFIWRRVKHCRSETSA